MHLARPRRDSVARPTHSELGLASRSNLRQAPISILERRTSVLTVRRDEDRSLATQQVKPADPISIQPKQQLTGRTSCGIMAFAVSLRRSRWWLYTKAYILGAMVSLFTATPVSSRIPSAPAQIQQQLTRLQVLRENVQREETRFREALSRAGIPTGPPTRQRDSSLDLEQGFGNGPASRPGSPMSPSSTPWAIERALESLGERAQAEARQRQHQQMLQEAIAESPASEPDLDASRHAPSAGGPPHFSRQRSSTAPPAPEQLRAAWRRRRAHAESPDPEQQDGLGKRASRTQAALSRWSGRFRDLRNIRRLMSRDEEARALYPEVDWDAQVRKGNELSPLELQFLEARIRRICTAVPGQGRSGDVDAERSPKLTHGKPLLQVDTDWAAQAHTRPSPLHVFLDLPASEKIHPDDVPIVSLGGSGGGYRAKFGFAAFIAALETGGAWQVLSYVAGVSGSCWTIAELYTHAKLSPAVLIEHYKRVAAELAHPLSLKALNIVANTRHGVYFLLAPLLRKAQSGVVGLGIMDLYATMTTCYQFLPRPVRAATAQKPDNDSRTSLQSNAEEMRCLDQTDRQDQRPRAGIVSHSSDEQVLSRTTFQWSKTLTRAQLLPSEASLQTSDSSSATQGGAQPLPILTAVRVSYGDPTPSFLTRKAGVGRRGPREDDFEREELPQYKAQQASEEDVLRAVSMAHEQEGNRRKSLALLEGQRPTVTFSLSTETAASSHLTRIHSEPKGTRLRSEPATALELELEKERGGLPHPYDELVDRKTRRPATATGYTTRGNIQRPNVTAGPPLNSVLEENLSPQERLQRARTFLIQSRRQRARALAEQASSATGLGVAFQWFEISPIEVGSSDVGAWIPTWSFGRTFLSGRSLSRQPEASLSLLLGQCTSAPAGPLTGYIAALLASLPAGWTLAASLLGWINAFVRAKRWERRWGNPIRAADEPNPFYGLNLSNETAIAPPAPTDPQQNTLSTQRHDPSTRATPRVPARAMVRGRGQNTAYHPQAGPEFFANSRTPAGPAATPLEATDTSDSKRLPPRAMVRGRGAACIYSQQRQRGSMGNPSGIEMRSFASSSGSASTARYPQSGQAPKQPTKNEKVSNRFEAIPPGKLQERGIATSSPESGMWTWEASGRIKLMDSGLSNNLPSHVLMHPGRNVDVIIAFDASSDVQKGAAVQRIHEFGRDRGLRFRVRAEDEEDKRKAHITASGEPYEQANAARSHASSSQNQLSTQGAHGADSDQSRIPSDMPASHTARSEGSGTVVSRGGSTGRKHKDASVPIEPLTAEQIRDKFQSKYAQIIDGWKVETKRTSVDPNDLDDDWVDIEQEEAIFARDPDVRMVYCPLLPSAHIPDFDPSTSAFSTSYNLVWTPDQVETLTECTKYNASEYAIDAIRKVVREVYEAKKRRRLAQAAGFQL